VASARRVRLTRPSTPGPPRQPPIAAPPAEELEPAERPAVERRANRGATQREIRVTITYLVGIAVVYALLVAIARTGPTGSSGGTSGDLLLFGLVAIVLAAAGTVVSVGAAPRSVELGDTETVVVGRFGRRYRFPGRGRLRWTVLQRFPAGPLSPVTLESVEISGGTTRRSFLLEEQLLEPAAPSAAVGDLPPR